MNLNIPELFVKVNRGSCPYCGGIVRMIESEMTESVLKGTLPHEQTGKYSGARVFIKPAAPGTGVIAGGAMRAVLESVGVKDVLAKSKGSSNPHSVVKATINALIQLKDPYTIAKLRGIEMDRVFNG
jgi:small subunit ribosomal protein S5